MSLITVRKLQYIAWLAFFALFATPVRAQLSFELPMGEPDSRTVEVQRKVDELFERGEYDRAYFIYRNELAPLGDKYAQYMLGFMHLTGKGVDEDPVAASAWYRLAAERGTPQFMAVRDMLMSDISADQHAQSDRLFLELRHNYSDLAILLALIKRAKRGVEARTGSRLKTTSSPVAVFDARSSSLGQSSVVYYGRKEEQIQKYLTMLSTLGGFPDLDTDPTNVNIDDLERRVNERLATIND
jgi:TPR repeat protein